MTLVSRRSIIIPPATPTYNPGTTAQDDNEESVSDAEALGLALRDKALSLGADFLGGALSGAATSGARVAAGRVLSDVELRQSGKVLRERDANAAELLIRKAQEADVDSDVYKNAAALQQKLDNGGKISDYEIGKLFSELSGYVQEHGPLGGTANVAQDTAAQPEPQPTLALPRGDEVQPTQTAPEPAPVDRASAQTASAAEIQPQAGETRDGNVQAPAQPEQASAPENAAQELTIYPPAVQQAWNILQDLQDADELTDAQQQMVDAAYATLNEFFAENDTQPEAMAPAERIENNGQPEEQPDVLHLHGQQRVSAADDAGAVRPLEAGGEPPAGRTFDGRGGERRQPRLANDRLREAQNRGLMPGSTRELGWADGTNEPRVILYPEDAWDEELQSVATQWRGQGYQVQFVIGPLEFQRDGFEQLADSVVQGNQIAIRANSIRWSAQQLSEHEGVHVWGGQHAQQRAAMLAELQDTLRDAGEPGMQMWSRYAEAYGEAYNGDQDALLEEIAADVWAGINRVGRYADDAVVDQLLQVVERYVGGNTPATLQQATEAASPARGTAPDRSNPTRAGPGDKRYSFAGQLSQTANHGALGRAKEMDRQGVDMETIRRETKWFVDKRGDWKYEISDRDARIYPSGDARFQKDHPEYAEYQDLMQQFFYGDLTAEQEARMQELDDIWGREQARLRERLENGTATLENILEHDQLFEAYPQLRDVKVELEDLPAGTEGSYDRKTNTVTLPRSGMRTTSRGTVAHEWQHAIQKIEDFARGSSPAYWNERMEEGYSKHRADGTEMTPYDLYRNTAGEIEARDVANRLDMTDEERMATPPDLGDENTVFAEDSGTYFAMSAEEQAGIREQLREHQSELNEMPPVGKVRHK